MTFSLTQKAMAVIFNNRFHVFLMPVIMVLFWDVALNFSLPWYYLVMITINTAGAYIYNILTDKEEDRINYPLEGRIFTPDSKLIKPLIVLCFAASMAIGSLGGWRFLLYGMLFNNLGRLYSVRISIGKSFFRLKTIPWVKNAYSAILWSIGLILFPYLYIQRPMPFEAILAIVINFLIVFFVELAWDLRDMKGDSAAGVRTIPLCWGKDATRWMLHGLNLLSVVLVTTGIFEGFFPFAYLILLMHGVITVVYVERYLQSQFQNLLSHFYLIYSSIIVFIVILAAR